MQSELVAIYMKHSMFTNVVVSTLSVDTVGAFCIKLTQCWASLHNHEYLIYLFMYIYIYIYIIYK